MNIKKITTFVGSFAVIYFTAANVYQVVLVRRKIDGSLELPGGGLEEIDINQVTNPFVNCVLREVEEESDIIINENRLIYHGNFVQRVPIGTDSVGLGTVYLYSYEYPKLLDSKTRKIVEGFTSPESSEVVVVAVEGNFFERKDISLATRRMIAIALNRLETRYRTEITYSALSFSVYVGKLGDIVFDYEIVFD